MWRTTPCGVLGTTNTLLLVRRAPHCGSKRTFYAGLDDSRVHRLRRSGMTFNRPRGRDTLSLAFESRIRLVPFLSPSDLYGPLDVTLLLSSLENALDPTSSKGSPFSLRKEADGDDRMHALLEQRRHEERKLLEKRRWNVLVVDPIDSDQVEAPVPFPSVHPVWYSAPLSQLLERRRRPLERLPLGEGTSDTTATSDTSGSAVEEAYEYGYPAHCRGHLRQNGDSTLLPGSFSRVHTLSLPKAFAEKYEKDTVEIQQHFRLAACLDPFLDVDRYHREEAQVEMITAFRNILYETAEISMTSRTRRGSTLPKDTAVADVVRIPALSVRHCGPRFQHEIGKLNQQALLKGFHRLSNEAKEALILNRSFSVELFVPPVLLEQFEAAFLEEAWETPSSIFNPGRVALYPGLAPPRSLLDYDGWVGKRPELVEAVETEGKSLLRGQKYNLDGTPIESEEVYAQLRLFGSEEARRQRLEGERKTAAAAAGLLEEEGGNKEEVGSSFESESYDSGSSDSDSSSD